tara:strand:+ start:1053 stop:1937 length:885 start_codon:yes stop_codon:yes gene_type:complete
MRDLTLLVMAAGMGSRYGGLKQLDPVGPNGETIIDYSVHDAIQAGFNKVVFIVRDEFKSDFEKQITHKYNNSIAVEFSIQRIDDLPKGYSYPSEREKPWGTGQAVLSAMDIINEPFIVINGDDFYGSESFKLIADYYNNDFVGFCMVAYLLKNTLSDHGGVSRGVCEIDNGYLSSIVETHEIIYSNNTLSSSSDRLLNGEEPVSMNMWGFTPELFIYLNEGFNNFLEQHGKELKSEYLIPSVVNELINAKQETVHVLHSDASWFGVTYKEDKLFVKSQILKLIESGAYPNKLFI